MAYGQVNTPGSAGAEIVAARQIAQTAMDKAQEALTKAGGAQSTANAALEKANAADTTANAAKTTAEAAMEKATANETAITEVGQTATTALDTANTANREASAAKTAAQNAQKAAEDAAKAVTDLNSTINTVPTQNGNLYYTGQAQSPTFNGLDTSKVTLGGTTSGTNVGTYNATVTPKEGFKWPDGTTTAKTITWTISRAVVNVPTAKGGQTYTGSELTAQWNGYDSSKMTIGGTHKATNVGSYSASFTPGANYCWPDGTTTAKTVSWSVGRAAGSLSLNKTTMSLDVSNLTGTIAVTRPGDGAITASSSNTSIATVSVSGTTVTVTAKGKGTAKITINVAAGTNHTAPASKECTVTVTMPSTSLADNTPATIKAVAKAGTASNYWSVGDKMGIAVNGSFGGLSYNSTVYTFILGFNHNASVEGNNSIHFQFGKTSNGTDIAFVQNYGSTGTGFCMNTSNTTSGGGSGSYMRKTICPAFLSALPTAWQNIITACTKYSDNTGGGSNTASNVTSTSDKIWLLSEHEVHGTRSYANSAEANYQKQYDYYKNGNSKVKYQHSATTSACRWWLRSVIAGYAISFCIVSTSGGANSDYAYYSYGFAPGFKVA